MRTAVALGLLVLAAGPARAECRRAVVLAGNAVLVEVVGTRLAASAIATTETAGCPSVRVELEQRGPAVHLRVTDTFERLGERDVRDAATAAAIIESWTLQEIDPGELPELAPPRPWTPTGIAVAASSSAADNSALWAGVTLAGCVAVGPVCAGATLRYAADTTATGATSSVPQSSRQLDALATVDVALHAGGFVVTPGVLVGYGHLGVTTTHMDAHMMKFDVEVTSHQLRAGLHATIAHPVAPHVAAFVDVAGDSSVVDATATGGPAAWLSLAAGLRIGAAR